LSEYLDDATAPDVKQELEAHIQECPSCWVVFDTTQKTIQVYKGMEPQPLPEAVHERLVSALQKKRVLGAT
jgi:anti-sigma factor RsiW